MFCTSGYADTVRDYPRVSPSIPSGISLTPWTGQHDEVAYAGNASSALREVTVHPLDVGPANHQPSGPLVFIVLDGVGIGREDRYDAVASANTPALDRLHATGIRRSLRAHGTAVGLSSDADMGNSEVGHNTLGAGRIFDQGAKQIDKAIESGHIFIGEWQVLVQQVLDHASTLHLIGLLSDGNVHSSIVHLFTLIDRAVHDGVPRLRVHILLDGRDVPDFTALDYVEKLETHLSDVNRKHDVDYRIASGGGRMTTTMDRYGANWSVVEAGWHAHVLGTATPAPDATTAIERARRANPGVSDQDLPAFTVVDAAGIPVGPIVDGDSVLVFNFRGDRAIEIVRALTEGGDFSSFDRVRVPDAYVAAISQYDADLDIPKHFLVHPESVPGTASEYLAVTGVTQFACAETQKFGHITYFWNGNRADKFDPALETYVEIPSDKVPFQTRPEMKSKETADTLIEAISSGRYRFIRANFAGGDMVGHTADLDATYRAIEAIDNAVGRVAQAVEEVHGCLVITADHGNAEDMAQRDAKGKPLMRPDHTVAMKTSHSLNPVDFLVVDYDSRHVSFRDDLTGAGLANVAASLIELLGFVAPTEYEPSLIRWS